MEFSAIESVAAAVVKHHVGPEAVELLYVAQVYHAVIVAVNLVAASEQIVERAIVSSAEGQAKNAADDGCAVPRTESWRRHRAADVVMHRTEAAERRCHRRMPRRWAMTNHSMMVGGWLVTVTVSAGTHVTASDVIAWASTTWATGAHVSAARTVVTRTTSCYIAAGAIVVGTIAHISTTGTIAAVAAAWAVADVAAGAVVVVGTVAHVVATAVACRAALVERTAHCIATRLRCTVLTRTGIVDAAAATIHFRPVAHFAALVVAAHTVATAACGCAAFAAIVVASADGCCCALAASLRHRSRAAVASVASAALCHCIA